MKIIVTENQNKFIRRYQQIQSGIWDFVLRNRLNVFHKFDDFLVELSWDVANDVIRDMNIPERDRVVFRNQLIHFIRNNFYTELKEFWDRNNPLNENKEIPSELRRRINKFEEELNTTLRESDPCEYSRFDQYKRGIMNYTLMPFLDDEGIHLDTKQNVFTIRDFLIKIFENKIREHYDVYSEMNCPDDPEIIKESIGPGDGIFDEVIPGGTKTLDNMYALSKTYDDLFNYSERMSSIAPSKSIDDFIGEVAKYNKVTKISVDSNMLRRFIANDPILTKELMEAAAKIAEERVILLMSKISFNEVFTKAGFPDVPKQMNEFLKIPVDSSTIPYINRGMEIMGDLIKNNSILKNSEEGTEMLSQIEGKNKQIKDFEGLTNLKTKIVTSYPKGEKGVFTNIIGQLPKGLSRISTSFIGKTTLESLTYEINRLIPKEYLTNPKEVSKMIMRLNDLGGDINKLNVDYIKKHGQSGYDELMRKYLFGAVDKKTFISELKNVKNPNIRLKPILGYGADHQTYLSITNPDKVIKVELRPGEIDKWYGTFNSNPKIFPKTYKTIKVKGKNGEILTAAVVEKVNVGPFHQLWDEMENLLRNSQKNLPASEKFSLEYLVKRRKIYGKQWMDFVNYLKNNRGPSSQKIDEFLKMVDELYDITSKPDIRKFNFGYDKSGSLKCLDI
jgi:hypothetical protein